MGNIDWPVASRLKPYLDLNSNDPIPARLQQLFIESTHIMAPNVQTPKKLIVFLVRDHLTVLLTAPRYAEYWKDVIIYDIAKIEKVASDAFVIVIFLEELAHAWWDILDEAEVSRRLVQVYPAVRWNEQTHKYELA